MVEATNKVVVLTISEKINSSQRFNICTTFAIHTLVTKLDPSNAILSPVREKGLEILLRIYFSEEMKSSPSIHWVFHFCPNHIEHCLHRCIR